MAEDEDIILKQTLENQQIAIKKLQTELDEERKASKSGTEEALSMIFRLQEEKSTKKLEYLQYKRIMEEKLRHHEESLAILREIIFLKDTEIDALRYQIKGYKRKLLSACIKDPFHFVSGFQNLGQRNVSLPAFRLEELCSEVEGFGGENFSNNISNNFDGFEKKLFKNCKERNFENLYRSKSSIKDILTMDNESVSSVEGPRRTSSVLMLRNPCKEPEIESHLQDIFEIPESLKKTGNSNPGFSLNENNIESIKLKIESIEREVGEMRESDLVSRETQLELLTEIRNKVNLIQYQIQQKEGEIQQESENPELQVSEIRRYPSRQRSRNEHDDLIMSYYIEAMLSFSL